MPSKGTIVLTGANGTIGSAVISRIMSSRELFSYHGIYIVRNASYYVAPEQETTHAYNALSLELSSLDRVRAAAVTISYNEASSRN
ncbi:hypothetical protein UA08_05675 [Talaromyces atroroseus]|uniref:NAD-dependent epimerase/dehydratase domain-containing protein n=1 Tax=Talaromyces atroroseus TaxID=1441469 RepID=A0A225ADL9_TALAT|nr:hypothetical protein UA08_05675 [Talaromyces atroroseus]OKL59271.1 hypothetical protein UA08_05675 [Talaromyces atroroseus]